MSCRGGRDASERKNGIGENERQPEMVTSCLMKAFQFGDNGYAKEKKPSG